MDFLIEFAKEINFVFMYIYLWNLNNTYLDYFLSIIW